MSNESEVDPARHDRKSGQTSAVTLEHPCKTDRLNLKHKRSVRCSRTLQQDAWKSAQRGCRALAHFSVRTWLPWIGGWGWDECCSRVALCH